MLDAQPHSGAVRAPTSQELRRPAPQDASRIWALVRRSQLLDRNSPYAYLVLCSDFADTGVVAEEADELAGFVLGYRPPPRPDAVFVWQIATRPESRGLGLATRLLDALLDAPACREVRFLEATVTPSNAASQRLFSGFARRRGAPVSEAPGFAADLFPDAAHEREDRIRIGPLERNRMIEQED